MVISHLLHKTQRHNIGTRSTVDQEQDQIFAHSDETYNYMQNIAF